MSDETAWNAAVHVEDWAGEVRVNMVRCLTIVAFYGQHLLNYFVFKDRISPAFHTAVTAITIAWFCTTVALHICLSSRWRAPWLSWAAVSIDLLLATTLLMVNEGPRSPFLVLLLLILVSTAVRLNLGLVRFGTLGAAIAYGAVLLHAHQFRPEWAVPVRQRVIFMLALGCAGLIAGQSVRRTKRFAQDFHDRVVFLANPPDATGEGK